jgi:hypothetical protein
MVPRFHLLKANISNRRGYVRETMQGRDELLTEEIEESIKSEAMK